MAIWVGSKRFERVEDISDKTVPGGDRIRRQLTGTTIKESDITPASTKKSKTVSHNLANTPSKDAQVQENQKAISIQTTEKQTQPATSSTSTVKSGTISFNYGTGEQIVRYSDGREIRLNINPYAEVARQGGKVEYTETVGGRKRPTSIVTPPGWVKETKDETDVYSPPMPVNLILKEGREAEERKASLQPYKQTTAQERYKASIESKTEPLKPGSLFSLYGQTLKSMVTEYPKTFYSTITDDTTGEIRAKSAQLDRASVSEANIGTPGGKLKSTALSVARVPFETVAFITENPPRATAIVTAGAVFSSVPAVSSSAFPGTKASAVTSSAFESVGSTIGTFYIPGVAKRLSETSDIPKTTGQIVGEVGLARVGYNMGKPEVIETNAKYTKLKADRIIKDDQAITNIKYTGQFQQKTTLLDTKIKFTGAEGQIAKPNPDASSQILVKSEATTTGTILYTPKGPAKTLRDFASFITKGKISANVPPQSFKAYGETIGVYDTTPKNTAGTLSTNQLLRTAEGNIFSDYTTDITSKTTVKTSKKQIIDGLKSASTGEVAGIRNIIKPKSTIEYLNNNKQVLVQSLEGREVGLSSSKYKYDEVAGKLIDISTTQKKPVTFSGITGKKGTHALTKQPPKTLTPQPQAIKAELSDLDARVSFSPNSLIPTKTQNMFISSTSLSSTSDINIIGTTQNIKSPTFEGKIYQKQNNQVILKAKETLIQEETQVQVSEPALITQRTPIYSQKQRPVQEQTQITPTQPPTPTPIITPVPALPMPPIPPTPNLFIPPAPMFSSGFSKRQRRIFNIQKSKTAYMPTVYASLSNLRASSISKTGTATGLGLRPIISKKPKKRKKTEVFF